MYTAGACEMGRGERSNPLDGMPVFTPGPGNYATNEEIREGGNLLKQKGFGYVKKIKVKLLYLMAEKQR